MICRVSLYVELPMMRLPVVPSGVWLELKVA
jgi:hypothetical protein